MNNNKSQVLIGGAVIVKDNKGKDEWFLVRQDKEGNEWEFPKALVRKGESSVRAVLRVMGEKGGMTTRLLEEAGRAGGATTIGDKTVPQRQIYYLMLLKIATGEPVGFEDSAWMEYSSALKKVYSKREKTMLKQAREIFKEWKKEREKRRKKQ